MSRCGDCPPWAKEKCPENLPSSECIDKLQDMLWDERKSAEWIYPTNIIGFGRCGNCKALWDKSLIDNIYFKYCPRCGAKMKGEK